MSQEYFLHTTDHGERWDLIAYHFYGDAKMYQPIVRANPEISARYDGFIPLVLPKGTELRIPVLDLQPAASDSLPIWKRP